MKVFALLNLFYLCFVPKKICWHGEPSSPLLLVTVFFSVQIGRGAGGESTAGFLFFWWLYTQGS